jgi:hypothetical protein
LHLRLRLPVQESCANQASNEQEFAFLSSQ